MTGKKVLGILIMLSALLLLGLAVAGAGLAQGKPAADPQTVISDYVGSEACVGCHSDKVAGWMGTAHSHMVTKVNKPSDIPGFDLATEAQKAEMLKADYVVAGQRLIAKDHAGSMDYKYLNVQYDPVANKVVDVKGGSSWTAGCAGCHSVNPNQTSTSLTSSKQPEMSIGCESCHGPGKAHVLSKGDRSKITVDYSSETCASCHTGGTMPDGGRWPANFQPGMKVADTGFQVPMLDKADGVPDPAKHLRQAPLLAATKHATAMTDLLASGHANDSCAACHSATAFVAKQNGQTVHLADLPNDGVSCVLCHDPHNKTTTRQLRQDAAQLCVACHTNGLNPGQSAKPGAAVHEPHKQMLGGYGAPGVPETAGIHTKPDISCVDCHMTEGNHMFQVVQPKQVTGTTRTDTCSTCHKGTAPESRQAYIDMWQAVTKDKLASLHTLLDEATFKVKATPDIAADQKLLVDTAMTDISFVEGDGSFGAHNFEYAMKTLAVAEKNLKQFLGLK